MPFPNSSNDKRSGFARRKLPRMAGPPLAVNARSLRRTERIKKETAKTEGIASENGNETMIAAVTTATRIERGTGIGTVIVIVNGTEIETMRVEEASIIDETIMTTVIGPRGTTGIGTMVIDRRSITRSTTERKGGGTASIGMTIVKRRVGARGSDLLRRNATRGAKR